MNFDDKTSVMNVVSLPVAEPDHRSACFVALTGEQAGRVFKLEEELVIGRGGQASILIEDEGVSRRHARIWREAEGPVTLEDLGSTNGTFCNGQRVSRQILKDGDKIQVGPTTILKFTYQDAVEEDFLRRQYESMTRDPLTRCYNRKFFLERLPAEIAFATRHRKVVSLAMIDIDRFKKINDTYGHPGGDHVLREVGACAMATVRADDVLARFGGEEFALIMRETPLEAAFIAVERLRRRVENQPFEFEGQRIKVTLSAGIAVCSGERPCDADELVRAADLYLYRAKESGRNRTECPLMDG